MTDTFSFLLLGCNVRRLFANLFHELQSKYSPVQVECKKRIKDVEGRLQYSFALNISFEKIFISVSYFSLALFRIKVKFLPCTEY